MPNPLLNNNSEKLAAKLSSRILRQVRGQAKARLLANGTTEGLITLNWLVGVDKWETDVKFAHAELVTWTKTVVQLVIRIRTLLQMVTYPIEAQTIESTVQSISAAADERKKYCRQNESEIYLFILYKVHFTCLPLKKTWGIWITIYKWHLSKCFGFWQIIV